MTSELPTAAAVATPAGRRRNRLLVIGAAGTVVYLASLAWFLCHTNRLGRLRTMPPNELGDFMAGSLAPLALLWVILTFRLQQHELQQNTQALQLQADEMRNSVAETRRLASAASEQLEIARAQLEQELAGMRPLFVPVGGSASLDAGRPKFALINQGGPARDVRIGGIGVDDVHTTWLGPNATIGVRWNRRPEGEATAELHYSDGSGQRWRLDLKVKENREIQTIGPKAI